MNSICRLCHRSADEEVVGFDIPVDEILVVYRLDSGQLQTVSTSRNVLEYSHHLPSGHAACLDAELSSAHIEEVLERRSEQVDDENVMETFLAKVVHLRNTD